MERHITEAPGVAQPAAVLSSGTTSTSSSDREMRFIFVEKLQNNQLERDEVWGGPCRDLPALRRNRSTVAPWRGNPRFQQDRLTAPTGPWISSAGGAALVRAGRFHRGTVFYSETITERKRMERASTWKGLFRPPCLRRRRGHIDRRRRQGPPDEPCRRKLTGWEAEEAAGEDFASSSPLSMSCRERAPTS